MIKTIDLYFKTSLLIIAISVIHNGSLWLMIGLQPWMGEYHWLWIISLLLLLVNLLAVLSLAGWLPLARVETRDALLMVQSICVCSALLICLRQQPMFLLLSLSYLLLILWLTARVVTPLSAGVLAAWIGVGLLFSGIWQVMPLGSMAISITLIALGLTLGIITVQSVQHGRLQRVLESKSQQLNDALRLVQQLTLRDDVTGLFNFRYMQQVLTAQKQLADRGDHFFVVAKLQVDDIQTAATDPELNQMMLVAVADVLKSHIRAVDHCSRIADDTFLLVLVGTRLEKARLVLQRIKMALYESGFEHQGKVKPLQLSIGLSEYLQTEALEVLIARVDQALAWVQQHGGAQIHALMAPSRPVQTILSDNNAPAYRH